MDISKEMKRALKELHAMSEEEVYDFLCDTITKIYTEEQMDNMSDEDIKDIIEEPIQTYLKENPKPLKKAPKPKTKKPPIRIIREGESV